MPKQITLLGRAVTSRTKCSPSCVRKTGSSKGRLAKGCVWAARYGGKKNCAVKVAGGSKTASGSCRYGVRKTDGKCKKRPGARRGRR